LGKELSGPTKQVLSSVERNFYAQKVFLEFTELGYD